MPDIFKQCFFVLVLCCSLSLPANGVGAEVNLGKEVEKIQQLYRNLTSLSFEFQQSTQSGGRAREGAGNAVFLRPKDKPGIMRWNYTSPDPQIILNDGSKLSIYTAKDHQVIVTPADALKSDITYAFFSGTRNVLDEFTAQPAKDRFAHVTTADLQAVQLVPITPQSQVKALHIWYSPDLYIHKLIIEDHFDSFTELVFSNIKSNTLDVNSAETVATITGLDLPPGTEVISQ
jgi:outer membrane lipoprotein carrier protein